jgi:hypothetical protein
MPSTAKEDDWIKRVLDFDVAANRSTEISNGHAAATQPALRVWSDAKDQVDQQLTALYGVLKQTGIPVLAKVAGQIESVLDSYRVGLITALMDYDQSNGPAKEAARAKALSAVKRSQATLSTDAHVTAADTNPFGVQITARTTLGAALATLQTQLSAH